MFCLTLLCRFPSVAGVLSAIIVMDNLPTPRPNIDNLPELAKDPEGKIQV